MKLAPPVTSTGFSFQNDDSGLPKTYSLKVDSMTVGRFCESGQYLPMLKQLDEILRNST
jgi:hypothetical protein